MSDESVAAAILALIPLIRDEVAAAQAAGEIRFRTETFVAPRVENFEYNEGNISHTARFEYVAREEWDVVNRNDFLTNRVVPRKEYADVVNEMVSTYGGDQGLVEHQVGQLLNSILRAPDSIGDTARVSARVAVFLKEVDRAPIDWHPIIWIQGLWVQPDEVEVNPRILLRRIRADDLEQEQRFHAVSSDFAFVFPSAVLEMKWRATDSLQTQTSVEAVLDVLRLYGLGAIASLRSELRPLGVLSLSGVSRPISPPPAPFMYKLDDSDLPRLSRLMELLLPRLEKIDAAAYDPEADQPESLTIALRRYKEALCQSGLAEARLTSAITALEALFLRGEERTELTHRLSQRVALLLSLRGLSPIKVYRDVARAYDIRSTYIHGSHIERERQAQAQELGRRIFNYTRISLLLFFLFEDQLPKASLLGKLDNALLDDAAKVKVKGTIDAALEGRFL